MSKKSIFISLLALLLLTAFSVGAVAKEGDTNDLKSRKLAKSSAGSDWISINEIDCVVTCDGKIGNDPATGSAGMFYPAGQKNLYVLYSGGLYLFGKHGNEIRSAAVQHVTEFQPGEILPNGAPGDELDDKYLMYKYNKGDVVDQVAIDMGCPAEVMGDQMLWCVYNDLGDEHNSLFELPPIGVEVQQTVWAYNRIGALGKTIFLKYRLINKNPDGLDLDSAYIGIWFDPDLGDCNDDAAGCDVDLGIGYVYNGDNNDASYYGAGAPAFGSDFFQGPIIPDPGGGTVVLNNGREYPESRKLDMTAFFLYMNGSTITGMNDPTKDNEGAIEAYFFVKGYRSNGAAWVDPTTGQTTKFPVSGDPTTGTGWLFRHIGAPNDVRTGNASGPFTLAVGDTQDVVLGLVLGDGGAVGGNNLASVALMKYNDAQAQMAYDLNFDLPTVPEPPVVEVTSLDEEIVLTWDDAATLYSTQGYEFEGYNIWMKDGPSGIWELVHTYDVANGITKVWDMVFDVSLSDMIQVPVQFGSDNGVQFSYTVIADPRTNAALINGKPYYFAVTAYGVNEEGTPKVLENAPQELVAIPQRPVLDEQLNTETGAIIDVTHATGPSQGVVTVQVVDPRKVTGHDYSVDFFNVEVYEQDGEEIDTLMELRWRLVDVTSGVTIMDNMTRQDQDSDWLPVDGLLIRVSGPPAGVRDIVELDDAGEIIDTNLHHSLNAGVSRLDKAVFYIHLQGEDPAPWKDRLNWRNRMTTEDYEIRFVDISEGQIIIDMWGNYLLNGYQSGPVGATVADVGDYTPVYTDTDNGRLPFQVWKIDMDGTRTQVHCGMHDTNGNGYWDGGYSCNSPWSDVNYERIYATNQPYDEAAILADGGVSVTDDYMWGEWWDSGHSFGRIIFSMYTDSWSAEATGNYFTEPPSTGTIVNIRTNKPNSSLDKYTFSTANMELSKNAEIAKERLEDINVFPNPYFAHNKAESNFFTQFVTLNNLPEECTIRVFSLSGSLVNTIVHNDGTPFERWYLINDEQLPVASGMYLIHVETEFGNKILKLGVVNREARYQHI
ncbi:T9SS type A sorting domain-containing protein [bacterium]|nr:T9SS type A sorting domain-containing protein [bacterium]